MDLHEQGESLVELLVLDVSGHNETIDADDLKYVPVGLEMCRANHCAVMEITGPNAVERCERSELGVRNPFWYFWRHGQARKAGFREQQV